MVTYSTGFAINTGSLDGNTVLQFEKGRGSTTSTFLVNKQYCELHGMAVG